MELLAYWLQENLLAVVCVSLTIILIYYYIIERGAGIRLSKRYRNSIFEAQSKVFLNATQYLISGNRDLAIKEFLNAVDINKETIQTYFALGGLFRSNGEIGKAISIHRSVIARDNISEQTRLEALKELAKDYDKGGFVDKAIEVYQDIIKINRDQADIIKNLCRIYEDIGEWDKAYKYRVMLSKVSYEDQSETISHIFVQKAKKALEKGDISACATDLDEAFRYAPTVSARILRLNFSLHIGDVQRAKEILLELLKENPDYPSFIFESLTSHKNDEAYSTRLDLLKKFFISFGDEEFNQHPSFILNKITLLKEQNEDEKIYQLLKKWVEKFPEKSEVILSEYLHILIKLKHHDEIPKYLDILLGKFKESSAKLYCSHCGHNSDKLFWRCPQCSQWETIQFRLKS